MLGYFTEYGCILNLRINEVLLMEYIIAQLIPGYKPQQARIF